MFPHRIIKHIEKNMIQRTKQSHTSAQKTNVCTHANINLKNTQTYKFGFY